MLPGFPGALTLGKRIAAMLNTQVGAQEVTYQGLLSGGPHRQRSAPRGCAPGAAWGHRPTLQPRRGAAPQFSPLMQASPPLRPPSSLPCWASCFELLAICRRRCAGLDAPGNKATKNSSQLTSTYFQKRK